MCLRIRRSGRSSCGCLLSFSRVIAGVYISSAFTPNQLSASIRYDGSPLRRKSGIVTRILTWECGFCSPSGGLPRPTSADGGRLPHEGVGWHGVCGVRVRAGASLQSNGFVRWCEFGNGWTMLYRYPNSMSCSPSFRNSQTKPFLFPKEHFKKTHKYAIYNINTRMELFSQPMLWKNSPSPSGGSLVSWNQVEVS